jgi:hypothetical protein
MVALFLPAAMTTDTLTLTSSTFVCIVTHSHTIWVTLRLFPLASTTAVRILP